MPCLWLDVFQRDVGNFNVHIGSKGVNGPILFLLERYLLCIYVVLCYYYCSSTTYSTVLPTSTGNCATVDYNQYAYVTVR